MDAICFALGVETSAIRGTQLEDLIYKEGEKRAASCSVALVLRNAKGEEHVFKRSVIAGKSELRVNNKKVKLEEYNENLAQFNIDVRAKNFLVLQGHVASIGGGGNGTVLTRLFEEVSGSGELEAEYEELRLQKEKAEETAVLNFQKKRGMDAEKKQFMEQEAEAARYRELLQSQADTRKEQMIFEVAFVNKQVEALTAELEASKEKVRKLSLLFRYFYFVFNFFLRRWLTTRVAWWLLKMSSVPSLRISAKQSGFAFSRTLALLPN